MTEEMWLPSRNDANRPRAGALKNRTCPPGPSKMTGSGSASDSTRMAETAGIEVEAGSSTCGSA